MMLYHSRNNEQLLKIGLPLDRFIESTNGSKRDIIDDAENRSVTIVLRCYRQTLFVTTTRYYTIKYNENREIIQISYRDTHTGL